jgi:hypothetical protein
VSCCSLSAPRALAIGAALLAVAAAPASASAEPASRALCRDVTAMRDSPNGYAIGYLHRPQRVTLLHDGVLRWSLVRSRSGLVGWISDKALCPAGRR